MIDIKEWWPAIGAPVVGFVVGIYHKVVVVPGIRSVENRVDVVEKRTDDLEKKEDIFIADIAELKTDVKWIRNSLYHFINGGKKK